MKSFLTFFIFAVFAALPLQVAAMQNATYDFSEGNVNARWEGKGDISMQQTPNGILLISRASTGTFLTSDLPAFTPEVVTVYISSDKKTAVRFVATLPDRLFASVPLDIPAQNNLPLSFSLRGNKDWKGSLESIGILLPPDTQVILNRIEILHWSLGEKLSFALKSFFVPDEYRPYSINFVWGPLLALNLIEEHSLFQELPPSQVYATYILNIILLVLLGILLLIARFAISADARKRFVIRTFFVIALAAWILMDLRMGSEFLGWVHHDYKSYISAPEEIREFRDRWQFYDFAEEAKQFLGNRDSYIFFAQQPWPYLGNIRYITYPAIPGINIEEDDTWVIYDRPDVRIDENGQLSMDGEVLSQPGRMLYQHDEGSFVFRTFVPPSPQ